MTTELKNELTIVRALDAPTAPQRPFAMSISAWAAL
jgi:hypothetical protein